MLITIDEAIRELTEPHNERQLIISPRFMKALGLSIEALKQIKVYRVYPGLGIVNPLPGETE